jgi:hypothetical protein
MKTLILVCALLLGGCANITGLIPSFNDVNQSSRIIDVELAVDSLDCRQPQAVQVARIRDNLRWFELYSLAKGSRQQDVLRLTEPIKGTVDEFYKRVTDPEKRDNPIYCDLKKRVLQEQTKRAAQTVLGRF